MRLLDQITANLQQKNLDRAVALAAMAARGRGPLVDHFAELGRRFATLLDAPQKPDLRVIDGGGS